MADQFLTLKDLIGVLINVMHIVTTGTYYPGLDNGHIDKPSAIYDAAFYVAGCITEVMPMTCTVAV